MTSSPDGRSDKEGGKVKIYLPGGRSGKEIFVFLTRRPVWKGILSLPLQAADLVRKYTFSLPDATRVRARVDPKTGPAGPEGVSLRLFQRCSNADFAD